MNLRDQHGNIPNTLYIARNIDNPTQLLTPINPDEQTQLLKPTKSAAQMLWLRARMMEQGNAEE